MSASPAPQGQSQWKEYKNSEGRVYWSHAVTKQSVWEKPDELKTPFERAISKTTWKQYTSKGKAYYVNSSTKETVWDLPPDLQKLKQKVEAEEVAKREREHLKATGQAPPSPSDDSEDDSDLDPSMALIRRRSRTPSPQPIRRETVTIPQGGFKTVEDAEEAFMYLLKREGIDETWTWDTTMRKIVQDPLWKALETLAQKKTAFEKWQRELVATKKAEKEARIAELKPHLTRLFSNSGIIKSYSTMKTAEKAFAGDKWWRRSKPEERREILEAYTSELKNREDAARRKLKEHNVQTLTKLIRDLDITVTTRWRVGHDIILRSDAFRTDQQLQKMETLDILNVFDEYTRQLEKEFEETAHKARVEQRRRARKARDGFKALLYELKEKGELTRTSKWKETLPKFRSDERYTDLLGQPGSSPLDLWMDAVDDLQIEAEDRTAKIESALKSEVKIETTLYEFLAMCTEAQVTEDEDLRKEAFDVIHNRLVRTVAQQKRAEERKRREKMEDLRYALRKVRQIEPDTTYDAALPHMQDLPEFKEVAEEEDRRSAFEKHTRRMREKEREAETSESGRRGDRDKYRMDVDDDHRRRSSHRDRERDRDYHRDREYRDREHGDRDRRRRDDRDRDRDHREYRHRDDNRDRERDRDRRRDRDTDAADRDSKRRRVTPAPTTKENGKDTDREEGEI